MPIYDFSFNPPQSASPDSSAFVEQRVINDAPTRVPDLHKEQSYLIDTNKNLDPDEVREVMSRGFYTLDEGFKNWLSDIKVPTRDSYKIVNTHIVTQDRSVLSWAQEFIDGRVQLPIISIQRGSWTFNQEHFHPPILPMAKEFTDNSRRRLRLIYRPLPFKINYSLAIWGEYRQDVEFISLNILKRCSPMAVFYIEDEYLKQSARVVCDSTNNNSDIDIGAERAKVIYEMSMVLEWAIPINEKIVPTILGRVNSLKETETREPFDVYRVSDY